MECRGLITALTCDAVIAAIDGEFDGLGYELVQARIVDLNSGIHLKLMPGGFQQTHSLRVYRIPGYAESEVAKMPDNRGFKFTKDAKARQGFLHVFQIRQGHFANAQKFVAFPVDLGIDKLVRNGVGAWESFGIISHDSSLLRADAAKEG